RRPAGRTERQGDGAGPRPAARRRAPRLHRGAGPDGRSALTLAARPPALCRRAGGPCPFAILLGRALGREVPARRLSSGGLVAVAAPAARATPSGSSAERDHEGTTVGQADVREVQDHPPPRARAGHLLEPPSQAAAGVGLARWLA